MRYHGRELDAIGLWGHYVEFPTSMPERGFAPLVNCPNPGHVTSKRHFQVNLDKPLVHCFAGCGISGTFEHAIAMIEECHEKAARKIILSHTRVSLGATSKRKVRDDAGRVRSRHGRDEKEVSLSLVYERFLPQVALEYLSARGIGGTSIATHEIGWDAEESRIVIPARDDQGQLRFLIKRSVRAKDWPKYLYHPEKEVCGWGKTDILYGACLLDLKSVSCDGLVLVEGSVDRICLYEHGIRNAGAILGTGLSDQQAAVIAKKNPRRVYLMFDKDRSGFQSMMSVKRKLTKYPLFVCLYPSGKSDPAELTEKEAWQSVEEAIPFVKFMTRLPESLRRSTRKERAYGR